MIRMISYMIRCLNALVVISSFTMFMNIESFFFDAFIDTHADSRVYNFVDDEKVTAALKRRFPKRIVFIMFVFESYCSHFFNRSIASIVLSRSPKAVSRRNPSPLGPKPIPGVLTI